MPALVDMVRRDAVLLLMHRSTFCTAFASRSLQTINPPTIAFNVLVNLAVCVAFTVFAFYWAQPPQAMTRLSPFLFRKTEAKETIAICFCAPAKTQALGIPLIAAMYSSATDKQRALIQVPMILYTAEQIMVGQVLVWLFKRWLRKAKEDEESPCQAGVDPVGRANGEAEK